MPVFSSFSSSSKLKRNWKWWLGLNFKYASRLGVSRLNFARARTGFLRIHMFPVRGERFPFCHPQAGAYIRPTCEIHTALHTQTHRQDIRVAEGSLARGTHTTQDLPVLSVKLSILPQQEFSWIVPIKRVFFIVCSMFVLWFFTSSKRVFFARLSFVHFRDFRRTTNEACKEDSWRASQRELSVEGKRKKCRLVMIFSVSHSACCSVVCHSRDRVSLLERYGWVYILLHPLTEKK